jgi:hypothetical protein
MTMTRFSDQLLTDLISEHGTALEGAGLPAARGGRAHPVRRAALLAGGGGALAVGLTAGLAAFGGGASPAYAVTRHSNGTLTVAVWHASGIAGANSELRSLNARVVVVPERAGCPSIHSLPAPPVAVQGQALSALDVNKESATVNAHGIPAGDVLVLGVSSTGDNMSVSAALTRAPAPSCVSVSDDQPGDGNTVRHETGSGTAVRTGSGSGNTVHDKNGGSAPAKIQPQDAGQTARTASG